MILVETSFKTFVRGRPCVLVTLAPWFEKRARKDPVLVEPPVNIDTRGSAIRMHRDMN